ncbi:MAG: MFS transporter, partial [Acidobacteriota bacterium]|nr:MFS transporter [Acidobacteriota bacterium]
MKQILAVRYLLVFWLFVLSAIAFLDRTNISFAGTSIIRDYRIDNVQLGLIFSAFLVGYAAFQVAGGWLAGRMGPRRVLAAGVIWWGVFTALTATIPTDIGNALAILIGVRFLLGAGEAVVYPATNQFVAEWIPIQERGLANGIIFAGVGAGAGLTPPLLVAVNRHYGWRASFWMCAVLGILAGIAWYLLARDTPEEHKSVKPAELKRIQAGRGLPDADAGTDGAVGKARVPWLRIFLSRQILTLTLSYFSFGYVAWVFFSWFYIYLVQVRGLDTKTSAFFSMLPFLAMTVCCLVGGAISDWLTQRYGVRLGRSGLGALSLGATSIFLALGARVENAYTAGIVLAGGAGALYLSQSCFWSVSADVGGRHSG